MVHFLRWASRPRAAAPAYTRGAEPRICRMGSVGGRRIGRRRPEPRAGRVIGIMDPTGRIMKNLHAAILVPRGPGSRARTPDLIDATYPHAILAL